jgi:alkanesulfonate monooxygenase SsuD/methylene tetrahydromethanopterin reductase-like flavin-dependent oxidoreductase (luciferase family)
MIGLVAAETSTMRVGSGGVMLPHYSPLKVAETFGMLSGLFPGRIDLGIGRAAGTSPRIAAALQRDRRYAPPDDFFDQMRELLMYCGKLAPSGPGNLAARVVATERHLGRGTRTAVRVCRLHQFGWRSGRGSLSPAFQWGLGAVGGCGVGHLRGYG